MIILKETCKQSLFLGKLKAPHKMRILIVDDQLRTRQSLARLLKTIPLVTGTTEAADGLEALEVIEETQPEIVIMDARMPNMDGLKATHIIKEKWPRTIVILLSMYHEYQEMAEQAGADAFVSKGDPPEILLMVVSRFLGNGPL